MNNAQKQTKGHGHRMSVATELAKDQFPTQLIFEWGVSEMPIDLKITYLKAITQNLVERLYELEVDLTIDTETTDAE